MRKLMAVFAFVVVASAANAESPTWTQVQQACGTEYRATKGTENRPTWQEFLTTCKERKGFVPKRTKSAVTLPDVK